MTTARPQDVPFIGSSAAIRQLDHEIEMAARSDAKVLITGETGVGKDVVARLVHQRSRRGHAPLSTINCAGLPDSLLESELFGHVRGSFTGAVRDKVGLLEVADGGTAFLDEAGEMSLRMQGMLLRVLETGEVQRVGCERTNRRVDVRIIAATNRDLARHIAAGAFREDLYYRLNVMRIAVAPLRDRSEDIAELFDAFASRFARQYGVPVRRLTPEAERVLAAYRWPGNVRELKNLAERLAVQGRGEPVHVGHLPPEYLRAAGAPVPAVTAAWADELLPSVAADPGPLLRQLLCQGESFWSVVHAPFMARDLSREQLRAVIRAGLEQSRGSYRLLVELFNMPASDYKRFLTFLRKHDCHVPFHSFRTVSGRSLPAQIDGRSAAR
jgi:transcriptional regulator with GAF, ATPase, and Fis domain